MPSVGRLSSKLAASGRESAKRANAARTNFRGHVNFGPDTTPAQCRCEKPWVDVRESDHCIRCGRTVAPAKRMSD